MRISLEQLFYGRGEGGYGILSASSDAAPFARCVEALCGAVGTPGGDYGGEPFLLSKPEGDSVIMICGRRGAPDGMGRATLFFHALIGRKNVLSVAKLNAFALFAQGAFADKMPHGEIPSLSFDMSDDGGAPARHQSNEGAADSSLPCVFRSDKPAPILVGTAVGERANELAWATFSFQSLEGFDAQVLPLRVAAPICCNEYDSWGKLIRATAAISSNAKKRSQSTEQAAMSERHSSTSRTISSAAEGGKSRTAHMLWLSCVGNFVLAIACVALFATKKEAGPSSSSINGKTIVVTNTVVITNVVTQTSKVDTNRIEVAAKESYRKMLLTFAPQKSGVVTTNLSAFIGFNGIARWKNSKDQEERQSFSVLQSIESLLGTINQQPKENNHE